MNTAARLAGLAEPGEVLVNEAVTVAVDDAGHQLLRGFDETILVSRLRPRIESPSVA